MGAELPTTLKIVHSTNQIEHSILKLKDFAFLSTLNLIIISVIHVEHLQSSFFFLNPPTRI